MADSPSNSVWLPKTINRFEVESLLGMGAFGQVFKAYDPQMLRHVTLKCPLASTFETDADVIRFKKEAQIAKGLIHPNIVRVTEMVEEEGCPVIVSDYVEGQDLGKIVETTKYDFKKAARIVAELAHTIKYAHQQGVIHRDLKPANVIIDEHGAPHIFDFGVAYLIDSMVRETLTGEIVGTVHFLAPEQATGRTPEPSASTDIYSLGAILFHLLTGEFALEGTGVEVLTKLPKTPARRARSIDRSIPLYLDLICKRCLEIDPNKRFHDASELAVELEKYLEGASHPQWDKEGLARLKNRRTFVVGCLGVLGAAYGYRYVSNRLRMEREWHKFDEFCAWLIEGGPDVDGLGVEAVPSMESIEDVPVRDDKEASDSTYSDITEYCGKLVEPSYSTYRVPAIRLLVDLGPYIQHIYTPELEELLALVDKPTVEVSNSLRVKIRGFKDAIRKHLENAD